MNLINILDQVIKYLIESGVALPIIFETGRVIRGFFSPDQSIDDTQLLDMIELQIEVNDHFGKEEIARLKRQALG